ncbi:maltose/maltodextrin ABC transporter substrate-binding protein MalE [Endozoicomonas sp. OPT23]|uniref:maltose/maltodextrin ABC transporter substrate-binding protein MalE n=1 Tax=Endozoicomonas sp. OPT23 TaxID=2072845 RepID=UPI00129B36CC|nr:maltose/maltodextrin ABC transporter substrate-binding protein MalE [Endozoicomonas sp. OPT23]MRI32337.1 maltose/maltodextrin ABC transporter substrate-binding protein MalE [Endozoicomonas sp. OPT23]
MIKKTLAAAIALSFAAGHAMAFSDEEITIWVGGDKAYKGMAQVGKLFEEETGIKVKVEIPENVTDRFQQAAATGQGPDIMFWAHDRYGEWAKAGLLAEVKPAADFKAGIEPLGWQGMTVNGKVYGYPIAMEAIGLIYNKDILPEAPASFEELFELDKKLAKKGLETIMWDQASPYFSIPMLNANGGYVFKETAAGYDVKDVGVNSKGAKKGAQMLSDLITKDVMPKGVDYGVMDSNFNQGKVAMMITGPWAWSNLDKSKINYGVAPIPSIDGSPSRAFVGVWGATINNATPNKELAQEFLENYLLTQSGLETMNKDVPLGAVANKAFMKKLSSDPRIQATYQNAVGGLLMPNVPEMGKFWSSMGSALSNITTGREPVDVALDNAAKRILN